MEKHIKQMLGISNSWTKEELLNEIKTDIERGKGKTSFLFYTWKIEKVQVVENELDELFIDFSISEVKDPTCLLLRINLNDDE